MRCTVEYLDAVKIKHGLKSDFALANKLKVVPSALINYRRGLSRFGDGMAIKVAEALDIDPAEILAVVNAERTKSPEARETWTRMAKYFASKDVQTDLFA